MLRLRGGAGVGELGDAKSWLGLCWILGMCVEFMRYGWDVGDVALLLRIWLDFMRFCWDVGGVTGILQMLLGFRMCGFDFCDNLRVFLYTIGETCGAVVLKKLIHF